MLCNEFFSCFLVNFIQFFSEFLFLLFYDALLLHVVLFAELEELHGVLCAELGELLVVLCVEFGDLTLMFLVQFYFFIIDPLLNTSCLVHCLLIYALPEPVAESDSHKKFSGSLPFRVLEGDSVIDSEPSPLSVFLSGFLK